VRDGDRRAGGRTARHDGGVDGIAGHGVGCSHADEAGGELVEIGLADDERARRLQPGDDECVLGGCVGEGGAGGGGRHARDVDVVLHREGDAPEGARRIGRAECFGFGQQRVPVGEVDEDAGVVHRLDAAEDFRDDVGGAGAGGDGTREAGQREGSVCKHRHGGHAARSPAGGLGAASRSWRVYASAG